MKRLLNTLFVTTPEARLSRDGETVRVQIGDDVKARFPIHTLSSVVCFGRIYCTPQLLQLCCERLVSVSFMSEYGRFWARVQGPVSGNVLLRREQYRRADDLNGSAEIARSIVIAKITNSRTVLQRAIRDRSDLSQDGEMKDAVRRLRTLLSRLKESAALDFVRGCEGDAAREYFSVFDKLIVKQKDEFFFHKRSRRPPLDAMNSLLSFFYAMLANDVASGLEAVGLDPAVGYLHRDRPGRSGLALDLMEEFRACFVDRLALSLVNLGQVKGKGFKKMDTGAVYMNDDTRKEILTAYQKRKRETIIHPFLNEKVEIGLLPFVQALLFARHLRGDLDGYPPFIWK